MEAVESTTPVPASELPDSGTFWSAQHSPASPTPWPPLAGDVLGLSAWPLGDGVYLFNDTNVNYVEVTSAQPVAGIDPNIQSEAFTTNDLWLQINSVTNNGAG